MRNMIAYRYLSQSLSTDSTDRTQSQTQLRKAMMLSQQKSEILSMGSQKIPMSASIPLYQKPAVKNPPPRLFIRFHHEGISTSRVAPQPGFRREVKDFLNEIWSDFGTLTDTYYHREFLHVYLTFRNRRDTFFAFDGLTDPIQIQVAICKATGGDAERMKLAKQLFKDNGNGMVFNVEWA